MIPTYSIFEGKKRHLVLQELCDFIDTRQLNKNDIIKIDITENEDETYTRIILIYFDIGEFDELK